MNFNYSAPSNSRQDIRHWSLRGVDRRNDEAITIRKMFLFALFYNKKKSSQLNLQTSYIGYWKGIKKESLLIPHHPTRKSPFKSFPLSTQRAVENQHYFSLIKNYQFSLITQWAWFYYPSSPTLPLSLFRRCSVDCLLQELFPSSLPSAVCFSSMSFLSVSTLTSSFCFSRHRSRVSV